MSDIIRKVLQKMVELSDTHVTARKASEITGYNEKYLREMCRAGELPFERAPGSMRNQVMIPKNELQRLKEQRKAQKRGRPKSEPSP